MSRDIAARWERITQLKREGKLEEAISLLEQEARDQEAEHARAGWGVAPGAFRELQKLYRKQGRHDDEVAVLHRWKAGSQHPDAQVDALIAEATRRVAASAAGSASMACPHCGVVLDPPPKRSRKCPECREQIVLRTDRVTSQRLALTPAQAADFDAKRAAASARKKATGRLEWLGVTPKQFDARQAALEGQWGKVPSPGDVYWSLANEKIGELAEERSWDALKQLYWGMAHYLSEEGRDHRKLQVESHRANLRGMAERVDMNSPVKAVEISANACCDACSRLDGRTMTLRQAREESPLPPDDCTRGWCNCMLGLSEAGIASMLTPDTTPHVARPGPPKSGRSVLKQLGEGIFGKRRR